MLELASRPLGDFIVVTVNGEIELDTADELDSYLDGMLRQDVRRIVLDLSGVEFCDSSGLRVLLRAHRHAALLGGSLRLAGTGPTVRKVLQISGLDAHLTVFDTAEAAVSAPLAPADTH
jgi:anti-sigma B factor antagonist